MIMMIKVRLGLMAGMAMVLPGILLAGTLIAVLPLDCGWHTLWHQGQVVKGAGLRLLVQVFAIGHRCLRDPINTFFFLCCIKLHSFVL